MILKRRLEADVRTRKNTARWLPAEDEQEEEDGDNDDEVCFVPPPGFSLKMKGKRKKKNAG